MGIPITIYLAGALSAFHALSREIFSIVELQHYIVEFSHRRHEWTIAAVINSCNQLYWGTVKQFLFFQDVLVGHCIILPYCGADF